MNFNFLFHTFHRIFLSRFYFSVKDHTLKHGTSFLSELEIIVIIYLKLYVPTGLNLLPKEEMEIRVGALSDEE